jgi:hypothetical protein
MTISLRSRELVLGASVTPARFVCDRSWVLRHLPLGVAAAIEL